MESARPNPFARNRPIIQPQIDPLAGFAPQPGQIRIATVADLNFVEHVRKKNGHALGFLPLEAIEKSLEGGHIRICCENDDNAGYILSRPRLKWQPKLRSITHAAVLMDAQRRHHGLAILKTIEDEARADNMLALQACCAVGLDSNEFWRAAGFQAIVHMTPETKSGREIICWRKALTSVVPTWFAFPPQKSGHRALATKSVRDIHRQAAQTGPQADFIGPRKPKIISGAGLGILPPC